MSDSDRGNGSAYLRGDFLAVTILTTYLFIFCLAFYSGKNEERRTYEPHQHAISAADSAQESCVGRQGRAFTECVVEQIAAAEETSRDEQDLQAQQHMALWALLMVIVSAATLGATIWALTYVKKTLDETKRMASISAGMAKDAAGATKAMIAQNELTETGNRAWLSFEITEFGPIEYDEAGRYKIGFKLNLTNHGNMPALAVSCAAEIQRTRGKQIDINDFVRRAEKMKQSFAKAVAPKQTIPDGLGNYVLDKEGLDDNGSWPNKSMAILLVGVTYIYPGAKQICYTILSVYPGVRFEKRDGPEKFPHPKMVILKTLMA